MVSQIETLVCKEMDMSFQQTTLYDMPGSDLQTPNQTTHCSGRQKPGYSLISRQGQDRPSSVLLQNPEPDTLQKIPEAGIVPSLRFALFLHQRVLRRASREAHLQF
jgi:hypothetical protein